MQKRTQNDKTSAEEEAIFKLFLELLANLLTIKILYIKN